MAHDNPCTSVQFSINLTFDGPCPLSGVSSHTIQQLCKTQDRLGLYTVFLNVRSHRIVPSLGADWLSNRVWFSTGAELLLFPSVSRLGLGTHYPMCTEDYCTGCKAAGD